MNEDITLTVKSGRGARSLSRSGESLTDEEDSSGVRISRSAGLESQPSSDHEYTSSAEDYDNEDSWTDLSKVDVGPGSSESASRVSASDQRHLTRKRHSRRDTAPPPSAHRPAPAHRAYPPAPPSVGSNEDLQAYGHDLPVRRRHVPYQWAPAAGGQGPGYAPSYPSSGYTQYPPSRSLPPGQQVVPSGNPVAQYQYFSPQQGYGPSQGYFGHPHSGLGGPMGAHMPPAAANPFPSPDMMHHAGGQGYYPYPPQGYPMPHPMAPSPVYPQYTPVFSPPPQPPPAATSPAPPAEQAKDDSGLEELKQMILNERADREAREAAAKEAEEKRVAAAEATKKQADEVAAAAAAAAEAATTEAEKKAAAAAAEEAEKRKVELEEAQKKAEEEREALVAAAAAAASPPVPEEKKKPIRFKDAVGRKFSFPFHLCATWGGMEELIRQAFTHVDIIGPHVAEGHYDLIGPNNEIILPAVWETVIEPDSTITMHMWPMPEPAPDDAAVVEVPEIPPPEEEPKKTKKKSKPAPFWFGGARPKPKPKMVVKKT